MSRDVYMQKSTQLEIVIFGVVTGEKRLTRAQAEQKDLMSLLEGITISELNVTRLGYILLGTTKILQIKATCISEEVGRFLSIGIIPRRSVTTEGASRKRLNVLGVSSGQIYIDDGMLDFEDTAIEAPGNATNNSILFDNNPLGEDYGNMTSIEVGRDCTEETFISIGNASAIVKRRRLTEDHHTEAPYDTIRVNSIIKQNTRCSIKVPNVVDLEISPIIMSFLSQQGKTYAEAPEMVRESALETFMEPGDFGFGEVDHSYNQDEVISRSISTRFIDDLENEFVFNDVIKAVCQEERAEYFFLLLEMATNGIIIPHQETSYSPISCTKVV